MLIYNSRFLATHGIVLCHVATVISIAYSAALDVYVEPYFRQLRAKFRTTVKTGGAPVPARA